MNKNQPCDLSSASPLSVWFRSEKHNCLHQWGELCDKIHLCQRRQSMKWEQIYTWKSILLFHFKLIADEYWNCTLVPVSCSAVISLVSDQNQPGIQKWSDKLLEYEDASKLTSYWEIKGWKTSHLLCWSFKDWFPGDDDWLHCVWFLQVDQHFHLTRYQPTKNIG